MIFTNNHFNILVFIYSFSKISNFASHCYINYYYRQIIKSILRILDGCINVSVVNS